MFSHKSDNRDNISKYANGRNVDLHDIVLREGELVGRDDSGACQQYRAVRK
jgi:hypothetical protein